MGSAPRVARLPIEASSAIDPLLSAVICKLPGPNEDFPRARREAWLTMMAMAFDVAYGPLGEPIVLPSLGEAKAAIAAVTEHGAAPAAPVVPRQAHAGHGFYISSDGTACNAEGTPVLVSDIPGDEMVFDYRPVTGDFRDTAGISWADGHRGTKGLAPGVSFCGPG